MANITAEDPNEVEAPGDEQPPLPQKRRISGKKLVLFIIAPLLMLSAGGVGAWRLGFLPIGTHAASDKQVLFYDLPSMLVNLNSPGGAGHYLKLRIALQFDSDKARLRMVAVQPRVLDSFETYLRQLRRSDLNGAAGLYRVKEELLLRVNKALAPYHAQDVLLQQMLVQ